LQIVGTEDKPRSGLVREETVRRPRAAEPVRGSYAFHDTERVDHLREVPARNLTALRTARETAEPTRQARTGETEPAPPANAGEPESWPPMPSVPPALQGAAAPQAANAAGPSRSLRIEERAVAQVVGGAIWEAVPSVIEAQSADNDEASADRSASPETSTQEPSESRIELTYLGRASAHDANDALGRFEQLVERGAWDQLAEELEQLEQRSPAHTLLYVIARRETRGAGQQDIALTREAIGAVSQLLNVPETSPTALLLSKRLLRRNPWNRAQQPSKKLSAGLMLLGVSLGAGIGWLVTRFFM
jgi:hypothetical protein